MDRTAGQRRPLFMKTYGKQRRKLSAWISPPDNRRRVFDSTSSNGSDISSVEIKPPLDKNRDKPVSKPAPEKRPRRRAQSVLSTSGSEGDSSSTRDRKRHKTSNAKDCPPLLGRHVTRRRRLATSKLPKATVISLNSSNDFVQCGSRTGAAGLQPARRISPKSSADDKENAGAAQHLLQELQEPSLNACRRRPLYCSTPSGRPLCKPNAQLPCSELSLASPPVSTLLSDMSSLRASQCDPEPPDCPLSPMTPRQHLGSWTKPISVLAEMHHEPAGGGEFPARDVFVKRRSGGSCRSIGCHSGRRSENDHYKDLSRDLFSAVSLGENTGASSSAASAAGGAERLAEVLKGRCLTRRCVVLLERLDDGQPPHQLPGPSPYCLDSPPPPRSAPGSTVRPSPSAAVPPSLGSPSEGSLLWGGRERREPSFSAQGAAPSAGRSAQAARCATGQRTSLSGPFDNDHATAEEQNAAQPAEPPAANTRDVPQGRRGPPAAARERRRRSTSRDRPGTSRKVCVKGLSVSRWKSREQASRREVPKAGDCSITEVLNSCQPQAKGPSVLLSTSGLTSNLNLSSLLLDLSPGKHTWSRLKASLSIHRRTNVIHTPRRIPASLLATPRGAALGDVSQDLFTTPLRLPLPQHLLSQLLHSPSASLCEGDAGLSDAQKVYAECGQPGALAWGLCIPPQRMAVCRKIGEGTFGEVFSTTNAAGDKVALKIIPLEGSEKVNGEDQKSFGEILHEIIISKELSRLKEKEHNQTHGFIGLHDLHCVQGCYPATMLKAWDAFDRQRGSENDRPDFFNQQQVFLILEFEFGGSDLENSDGKLASLTVARSILHQVTSALAVAEQELSFEHRDLHWGNVLVKTTKEKKSGFLLNGVYHCMETRGVLVRIIDYSLSRLEIDGLTVSCDISEDEELFLGQGDYQFDIYRLMRQENSNNWCDYRPHSNVLWLHYLSSKLLALKYRGGCGKASKDTREELRRFHGNVLRYGSATEALQSCPLFQKT